MDSVDSPIGFLPKVGDITMDGIAMAPDVLEELLSVRPFDWKFEIESQKTFFDSIGPKLPPEIWQEHEELRRRIAASQG